MASIASRHLRFDKLVKVNRVNGWKTLILSGGDPFSSNSASIGVRHFAKQRLGFVQDLVRRPIRVFSPDGKLIQDSTAKRKLLSRDEEQTESNTSSTLFSKVLSEIQKNRASPKIALEGTRLIREALSVGIQLEYLFVSKSFKNSTDDIKSLVSSTTEVHHVADKLFATWSSVTTPPGFIGICTKSAVESCRTRLKRDSNSIPLPLVVICDNIREPGNLGSILRSAAAAGCKSVLLSKGCVDPWESKVLRGGCGGHFHIPIVTNIQTEYMGNYMTPSDADDDDESYQNHHHQSTTAVLLADSNENDSRSSLPISTYTDLNYTRFKDVYLVIGGETEGLTNETLRLSQRLQFPPDAFVSRIHIPLYNNFNSLNAAHSCSVILFEIARQLNCGNKIQDSSRNIEQKSD